MLSMFTAYNKCRNIWSYSGMHRRQYFFRYSSHVTLIVSHLSFWSTTGIHRLEREERYDSRAEPATGRLLSAPPGRRTAMCASEDTPEKEHKHIIRCQLQECRNQLDLLKEYCFLILRMRPTDSQISVLSKDKAELASVLGLPVSTKSSPLCS